MCVSFPNLTKRSRDANQNLLLRVQYYACFLQQLEFEFWIICCFLLNLVYNYCWNATVLCRLYFSTGIVSWIARDTLALYAITVSILLEWTPITIYRLICNCVSYQTHISTISYWHLAREMAVIILNNQVGWLQQ